MGSAGMCGATEPAVRPGRERASERAVLLGCLLVSWALGALAIALLVGVQVRW